MHITEKTREYYNSRPKKISAAQVLFFNDKQEILLVKPIYKQQWLLPGGSIEQNESPSEAARREVREEIGLEINNLETVCAEYASDDGNILERFSFIFFGGFLDDAAISKIFLQVDEISEYGFFSQQQALKMVTPAMSKRLPHALDALKNKQGMIYLENGQKINCSCS